MFLSHRSVSFSLSLPLSQINQYIGSHLGPVQTRVGCDLTSFLMPLSKSSSVSTGSLIYKTGQVVFLLKMKQGNLCKALHTVNIQSTFHGFGRMSRSDVQRLELHSARSKPSVAVLSPSLP